MEAREEQQTKHVSRMTNCLNIVLHAICPKTLSKTLSLSLIVSTSEEIKQYRVGLSLLINLPG